MADATVPSARGGPDGRAALAREADGAWWNPVNPGRRAGYTVFMAGTDEFVERVHTKEELREQQREWYARRPETDPRPPVDPDDEDDADGVPEEDLKLRRRWRVALHLGVFAIRALAMLAFGVRWWDFGEHGPWLTPLTPLLLGGAAERALLRRWPEWERDHDPTVAPTPGRGATALGERARPYWARTGAVGPGAADGPEGTTDPETPDRAPDGRDGARGTEVPIDGPGAPPAEVSARTDPSP